MRISKKIAIIVTVLNLLILGGLAFAKFFSLKENIVYFVSLFTFWLGIFWEGIVGKIFKSKPQTQVQPLVVRPTRLPERRPLPQREYPQEPRQLPPRQVTEQPREEDINYQQVKERPAQEQVQEIQRPATFHEPHPIIDTLKKPKKQEEQDEEFDYVS